MESLDRSPSTIIAYRKDLEQLFDYLEKRERVTYVTHTQPNHLVNYITELQNKGSFSLKTISRKINSMKTLFKYLHSQGDIQENPSEDVQHPKYKVLPPRILTELEYRALRDVARTNIRLYTIVELLLQTGMRIGELARLKQTDVTLEGKKHRIKITPHASNPERTIDINEAATMALNLYKQVRPNPDNDSGHFFITKTGRSLLIRNIRTSINKAFEKAGIDNATVNDIRNTFIVYQLEGHIQMERLAEYVGHKRLTSTKKYLDFLAEKYTPRTNTIKVL